ncbi:MULTISPECIES: type IVB secretion system protein IcmV [Legionella]|uniref:Intracellular multiplication protein IcmV n=1 Tax=Legionella drozanskii LLAP-1 TaxID=1212489 RepID=A0A0W0SVX6_9GAMM|nr:MULTISPECIES: type IVB secretion system protein IcmV [Legionella]KTC87411.1 intracellular multiplication protein IcmV [Legionella drozanskii LLAP-1]PJE08509.1 MAG: type IV secretion protein IcmV [Legionella sp.]
MKKQQGSRIVNVFARIFNVRSWIDFDRTKSFTLYLVNGFKKMFVPQKNDSGETFEEAVSRLNLSETELQDRKSALYRLSLLMSAAAILIFGYAIYHVFYGSYRAVIISLVVMLIALALAFRYHFWYFQIKERKLGCTMLEWYRKGLLGDKR